MGIMSEHMKERSTAEENISIFPALPQSLNIELNNTCNQRCIFCPEHGPYSKRDMKPSVIKKEAAMTIMKKAYEAGIGTKELGVYINGEVFLYRDLSEVIKYAKDIGFPYVFITTNGALANPDAMKRVVDSGLDSIRFSVNAVDPEVYEYLHGRNDYAEVEKNIMFLDDYRKRNGIDIALSLSCVVTKKTKDQIKKIREKYEGIVDEILFIPVMNLKLLSPELSAELELEDSIYEDGNSKQKICPIVFNSMYIEATGNVALCCNPCGENVVIDRIDMESMDDLNFERIWNSPVIQKYRKAFIDGDLSGVVCKECNIITQTSFQNMFSDKLVTDI